LSFSAPAPSALASFLASLAALAATALAATAPPADAALSSIEKSEAASRQAQAFRMERSTTTRTSPRRLSQRCGDGVGVYWPAEVHRCRSRGTKCAASPRWP